MCKLTVHSIFIVLLLFFFFLILIKSHELNGCTAHIISVNKNKKMVVSIYFSDVLVKNKGTVYLNGTIYENGKFRDVFIRKINFIAKKNGDEFSFTSSSVIDNQEVTIDDIISIFLPDFYIYPDSTVHYRIAIKPDLGILFFQDGRPLFVCNF